MVCLPEDLAFFLDNNNKN